MTKKKRKRISREEIELFYGLNINIKHRVIYFGPASNDTDVEEWMVDDRSASNLMKGLIMLNNINKKPITIVWLSYGGDWDAGMAIYDLINEIKSPVIFKGYGRCRSMGSIIIQSCDKRYLSVNCTFMIHYGSMAIEGHGKDVQSNVDESKKNDKTMEDIYLSKIKEKHPRYTRERLKELMKYDKFMTSQEAVDLGLADKVIENK